MIVGVQVSAVEKETFSGKTSFALLAVNQIQSVFSNSAMAEKCGLQLRHLDLLEHVVLRRHALHQGWR